MSRSNLLKCAIHGEDPNWGRVISAVGTTDAAFDPPPRRGHQRGLGLPRRAPGEDRSLVDMRARDVTITVDLAAGADTATIWTNDLTADYVHENSAYST